ncbi:MAG: thioredoxin-dependent thiol peroxidase [Acidimicrobiia bacterium]|nr:MAG: thioredoxin-dependent thiol peroxidase [Acidimicrobiia bacterium]
MGLKPGEAAPSFSAPDQDGNIRSDKDFAGTKFVIYFYPKAFTPGCTTEACDLRDRHELLESNGYRILGVSPDQPDKLAKFRDEYELPFDLLSDPDHQIATAFGAYGLKKNYGREYMGIIRSTFLIDESGTIEQAYYNVKATGHVDRVVNALESA